MEAALDARLGDAGYHASSHIALETEPVLSQATEKLSVLVHRDLRIDNDLDGK